MAPSKPSDACSLYLKNHAMLEVLSTSNPKVLDHLFMQDSILKWEGLHVGQVLDKET